jgi:hypothetical protein
MSWYKINLQQDIHYKNVHASQFENTIYLSTKDKVCQLCISVHLSLWNDALLINPVIIKLIRIREVGIGKGGILLGDFGEEGFEGHGFKTFRFYSSTCSCIVKVKEAVNTSPILPSLGFSTYCHFTLPNWGAKLLWAGEARSAPFCVLFLQRWERAAHGHGQNPLL